MVRKVDLLIAVIAELSQKRASADRIDTGGAQYTLYYVCIRNRHEPCLARSENKNGGPAFTPPRQSSLA